MKRSELSSEKNLKTNMFDNNKKSSSYVYTKALVTISFLSIAILFCVASAYFLIIQNNKKAEIVIAEHVATTTKEIYSPSSFQDVNIEAESFVVYDPLTKKIIASRESEKVFPLASVTKVMTGLITETYLPNDAVIKIQASDLSPEGDSGLKIGDTWQRDELVAYTLTVSSNDGARALARVTGGYLKTDMATSTDDAVDVFIKKMNEVSAELELSSLHFNNESGLDINQNKNGGYGSAADVAKLFARAYATAPSVFENTTKSLSYIKSKDGTSKAKNTNEGASSIPGLAASKTGYTGLAQGNLGVVIEMGPANPIVIVVLHSSKDGRFTDIEKLRKAVLASMRQ